MAGKTRPSLREKTLQNVALSNLSLTDKQCIQSVFEKFETLSTADVVEEASCKGCISYDACSEWSVKPIDTLLKSCCHFKSKSDFVEVVRCKDCKLSTESKSVSRYDLYCNNYDVRFCEKEQKIVCGTHFCSYGERKDAE